MLRQAASFLATPIFIVDNDGTLVYYNESAEGLLGKRYEEAGEMPAQEWGSVFTSADDDGNPIPLEDMPLAIAVTQRRPHTGSMNITGLDGIAHRIQISAIPLIGQTGRNLGSLAVFWETPLS